ncbi:MAG: hypothetical protein Kow00121_05540 [Elainellaceae cyanobacterium]
MKKVWKMRGEKQTGERQPLDRLGEKNLLPEQGDRGKLFEQVQPEWLSPEQVFLNQELLRAGSLEKNSVREGLGKVKRSVGEERLYSGQATKMGDSHRWIFARPD